MAAELYQYPYIYVRMYIVTSVYLGGCVHSWVSPSLMNYVILSVIIVWGNSVCTCVEFRTLSIELPIDSSSEFFQGLNEGLQIRTYVGSVNYYNIYVCTCTGRHVGSCYKHIYYFQYKRTLHACVLR